MLENQQMVVIGILGEKQVGKTFLLNRYLTNQLPQKYTATTAVEFSTGVYECNDGSRVKLKIWDTSSQEKYKNIVCYHLKECQGIFLMFDLTDENRRFQRTGRMVEKTLKIEDPQQGSPHTSRRVHKDEAQNFSKKFGCSSYWQVSVLQATNIQQCIEEMVDTILTQRAGKLIEEKMKAQEKLVQQSVCSNCFIY